MKDLNELLEKYRKDSLSTHDKGTRFEVLMKNFLLTYAPYRGKFSDVWLWKDFPFRADFGGKDLGIDIVAKTVDGEFWAVQCKFYADTSTLDKPAVDSHSLQRQAKLFKATKNFLREFGFIPQTILPTMQKKLCRINRRLSLESALKIYATPPLIGKNLTLEFSVTTREKVIGNRSNISLTQLTPRTNILKILIAAN